MSYTVFARKYRPQTFDEIVGQEHIVTTLKNAIAQNRLAQAYLFVGPRGTGKTTTARIFAKALNCADGPKADFNPNDPICREIAEGRSMNVLEFDAASNTQVDKIREIIIDNVKFAPSGSAKYKVYIVDEVHMLSTSSFNALLKTLEEPPAHVKFVFATTNVEKVPTTIISRCQRFDLTRIPTPQIAAHLLYIARSENPPLQLSPAAADTIARGAEGGLRDAESMLDQLVAFCGEKIEEQDVLNIFGFTAQQTVAELSEHLIVGDTAAALGAIHAQAEAGKDLSRLMADLIEHLRNLLVVQCDPNGGQDELSAEAFAALVEQSTRISADKLLELIEQFANAESRMKWAANKKMHFEIAAIRAIQTLSQATLTEVLDTLTALRGGGPLPEKTAAPKPTVARPPVAKKASAPVEAAPVSAAGPTAPLPAPKDAKPSDKAAAVPAEPEPVVCEAEPLANASEVPIVDAARASTEAPSAPSAPVLPAAPQLSAAELWPQFVARLRQDRNRALAGNFVEAGTLVEIANGTAVLAFPPDADLARGACDGKNRAYLEGVLSDLVGQPLKLKCEKRAGLVIDKIAPTETKPTAPTDPMEAFKNDPLIQKALADFKAEIIPA